MGYDMEWVDIPAANVAGVEQLWAKIKDAGHGHPSVPGLFEEMDELRDYNFRLNIWGMQLVRKIMVHCKMVDWEFKHTPFDRHREDDEEAILREYDIVRSLPPLYKFGSNDGWVVSPEEIDGALERWDALDEMEQREKVVLGTAEITDDSTDYYEWFVRWVEYWRAAREHGGFRVY